MPEVPDPPNQSFRESMFQQREDAILLTAVQVFSAKGYQQATMEEIALRVGIGKGTLYRHFQSKEAIFAAIQDWGVKRLGQEMDDAVADLDDPLEKIRRMVDVHMRFFYRDRPFFQVLFEEGPLDKRSPRKWIHPIIQRYEHILEDAAERQLLGPVPWRRVAFSLRGMLIANVREMYNDANADPGEVARNIIHILFHGILPLDLAKQGNKSTVDTSG